MQMNGLFLSSIAVNIRYLYEIKMSVGIINMKPTPKKINPYCCKLCAGAVIEAMVIPIYTIHHVAKTVSMSKSFIT